MSRVFWTPADDAKARAALTRHRNNAADAAQELTRLLGRPITRSALDARARSMGWLPSSGRVKVVGTKWHTDPVGRRTEHSTDPLPPPPDDGVDVDLTELVASARPSEPPDPIEQRDRRDKVNEQKRQIDRLIDQLREARSRSAFLDELEAHRAPPRILPRERASGMREMTAMVLASDWHVEETVTPESVAFVNEYNLEIAERRINRFFQGIIWNVEHNRASGWIAIRDLVLWLGGDLMSGFIHEELMESNTLSPTETILWLQPKLRDGIYTLLEELRLESLTIPCSYGNHGRTTHKPRISTGYANSYEWLMYHELAQEFRGEPRVRFEITPSAHQYVDVYGKTVHYHHGDDVKFMGGVGGLGIPLLKAVPLWDRVRAAAVHCIGHHHTIRDFGRALSNGSLIGYGPYSQRIRSEFEPPQQLMFYMDSKRGVCMPFKLWVDDDESAPFSPLHREAA